MMMRIFHSRYIFHSDMVANDDSTAHHLNSIVKANGPPSLLEGTSSGSNVFEQLAPINSPINIFLGSIPQ